MTRGMTRKERREGFQGTNFLFELLKVQKHFFPKLQNWLQDVQDPRSGQITYPSEMMLMTGLVSKLVSLTSMREVEQKLNTEECIENISRMAGVKGLEEIPHHDT